MSKEFKDMTNAELKELCEDFDLKVENPKTFGKPNKTEYLEVLNTFKAKQAEINGVDLSESEEVKVSTKKAQRTAAQLQRDDLFRKERVIVRDMQESQTKDEMVSVSWGNRLLGRQTDWIDLSGEPQYVRRGAISNLKESHMTIHTPKAGGGASQNMRKRFVVIPVDPLTDKEFEELANQQKMRNSKLA